MESRYKRDHGYSYGEMIQKLEKQYAETEIREIYKNNPYVEYINIAK